jgi:hypothetical protein
MRSVLLIVLSVCFLSTRAQTVLPMGGLTYMNPFHTYSMPGDSTHFNQKWYVSSYAGISAGYGFINGYGTMMLSVPVGLQLNHPLNNNLIAFAGVNVAPSLFSFNRSFMTQTMNPSYPGSTIPNAYGFDVNSGVQLGLMYVNDARTFSISGSIGVERSSFPVYPAYPSNRPTRK